MTDAQIRFPPLAITEIWARFNDELCRLVALVPEDRLDWTPRSGLWDLREILAHVATARDLWMDRVGYGDPAPDGDMPRTIDEVLRAYERTWARLAGFLAGPERLTKMYTRRPARDRRPTAATGSRSTCWSTMSITVRTSFTIWGCSASTRPASGRRRPLM